MKARPRASGLAALAVAATLAFGLPARGEQEIEDLSLDDLMQVDVTTVSGVAQDRFSSPAAIYVITADDLRRGGYRTLAQALRMVPGMFVGRGGTSTFTVGARGLTGNSLTTTRSLVLVDGRVAFDPITNGAPWDALDLSLDEVDRIEVIRGPGATLWGVNAMNGVINVITKSARDTMGTHLRAAVGTEASDAVGRYGGKLGRDGAYRVFARYADTGPFDLLGGGSANDQWTRARGGFRLDFGGEDRVSWMVQGEAYRYPTQRVTVNQPIPNAHIQFETLVTDDDLDGGHLLLRASRGAGAARGWSAQVYYDQSSRQTSRIGIDRDTADLDFRSWTEWGGGRQDLLWGAEIFHTSDDVRDGPTFLFDPHSRSWTSVNAFLQNTSELIDDRLFLLAGTKLTQHDFVGFELQPSVRVSWTPSADQTLWAGVSRPVRVPSRLEEEGLIIVAYADPGILGGGPPTGARPFGVGPNDDLEAEEMLAYELGHRIRLGGAWELDTALFYDDYRTLIGIVSPIQPWSDEGSGQVYGAEIAASWKPSSRSMVEASYSWLDVTVEGPILDTEERSVPQNLAQLRASFQASAGLEVHGALYYTDRLLQQNIDAYERLDLGVTWRVRRSVELALWGQNLLEEEHAETTAEAIPRGGFLQVTLNL